MAWEYRVTIRLALPPTQWPVVSNNRTTLIYVTRKAAALGAALEVVCNEGLKQKGSWRGGADQTQPVTSCAMGF